MPTLNRELRELKNQLKDLGLGEDAIAQFLPESKFCRKEVVKTPWNLKRMPPNIFSSAPALSIRVQRMAYILFADRFMALRSHLGGKNGVFSSAFKKESLTVYVSRNADIFPRMQLNLLPCEYEIDLHLLQMARYHALTTVIEKHPDQDKMLSLENCFWIAFALTTGEFFMERCICGSPLIVPNMRTRDPQGNFKKGFFHCPWCSQAREEIAAHLEIRYSYHNNWVGFKNSRDISESVTCGD